MTLLQDLTNGLGNISFKYRRYGAESQVDWKVDYSTDAGTNWTQIGSAFTAPASDDVQTFSEDVNVSGNVRVRILRATQDGNTNINSRFNIDNILMTASASGPGTPAIQFDSSSASASEAGVSIDVTITKSNGIGDVTGELAIGGTAPGADYSLSTTNISLLGAATLQDITITLVNNGAVDGDRTLILTITNLVGGDVGSPAVYTLTITDDDTSSPPPVPSSTNAFTSVTVSGGTITAVLQSSDTNFQYNFQYYTTLPGTPTVLTTSNGTGSSITFKDTSATNAVRIYGVEAFYPTSP